MANRRRGQGEGSIYQRKDGRWVAVVDLGTESGKRKRKQFYGATQAEALDAKSKAIEDLRRGLPIVTVRQTIAQFLDSWLAHIRPTIRPLTYLQYEQHVRRYLKPELGRHQLAKLSAQMVQGFITAMLEKPVTTKRTTPTDAPRPTLSPRTVQLSLVILRHALDRAVRFNLVARNVAKLVDSPRVKRHETRIFTPDEARQFVEAIAGHKWEAVFQTALTLGLREGELLGLRWSDIDFAARTLTVNQSVQRIARVRKDEKDEGAKTSLQFVETKTDRSRRTLSLSEGLVKALRLHRARQSQERLAAGSDWRDNGLVFTTITGTPIEKSNLYRHFRSILDDAKLPQIRFHDLRHSTASLLLARGTSPRVIMDLLGHSKISTTMDTYAHVIPAMLQDAVDQMDQILTK